MDLALLEVAGLGSAADGGEDMAVLERDALGGARGAGGMQQDGDIVRRCPPEEILAQAAFARQPLAATGTTSV